MDNLIQQLTELFLKFPGIGPKQARRFVYFLLASDKTYLDSIMKTLSSLVDKVAQCKYCYRYFPANGSRDTCDICTDSSRDDSLLLIVEKDVDFDNIRKSGTYNGKYFILGGLIPILEKSPEQKVRLNELLTVAKNKLARGALKEAIIAVNATTEGDYTADHLKKMLSDELGEKVKISILGRGLSTGTELEYIDRDTMKNALKNRG